VAEVSIENGVPIVHQVWCAADCGQMVNPSIVMAQIESSILFGLSAALGRDQPAGRPRTAGQLRHLPHPASGRDPEDAHFADGQR